MKKQQTKQPVVAEETQKIVNCSKCGAALGVKSQSTAYICPVCNTLFRLHTGSRKVQEIPNNDMPIQITFTAKALNLMRMQEAKTCNKKCKKDKEKVASLQSLLIDSPCIQFYRDGDIVVVDAQDDTLTVSKK